MTDSLVPIQIPGCRLTLTGAEFAESLSEHDWAQRGHQLVRCARALQWLLGDWVNFGQRKFGEKYKLALEITNYDEGTLRQFAWVCNSIQMSRRRDKLSFGHHVEVARMKPVDQDNWLALAEQSEWSVSDLRQAIRASAKEIQDDGQRGSFQPLKAVLDLNRWFTGFGDVKEIAPNVRHSMLEKIEPLYLALKEAEQ